MRMICISVPAPPTRTTANLQRSSRSYIKRTGDLHLHIFFSVPWDFFCFSNFQNFFQYSNSASQEQFLQYLNGFSYANSRKVIAVSS